MVTTVAKPSGQTFIPREHGATAMLLTPFFAAAILLRRFYWTEFVALIAVACAFAIKDPLVVMGRQRFVWKQEREETSVARRSALIEFLALASSGLVLILVRDWRPFLPLFLGAATFTALAVTLNVKNRQRSEWFQTASAVALTATSLMACLAAENMIPKWCWFLWMLSAMQAAAGIFVVHARLDARIAARKGQAPPSGNRRAAFACQIVLIAAAVYFAWTDHLLITAALIVAAAGYLFDLMRQRSPASLQLPLKDVGRQALGLSIVYTLLIIAGLWNL
ncbi:MAG TPA: YwiC-like family protein [Bryobacteraceae bacterium]|nr:YwiC-like family protein [Bryobacteraceae bacterium]